MDAAWVRVIVAFGVLAAVSCTDAVDYTVTSKYTESRAGTKSSSGFQPMRTVYVVEFTVGEATGRTETTKACFDDAVIGQLLQLECR